MARLRGHHVQVESIAFDRFGSRLVPAGLDRTTRVWDLSSLTADAGSIVERVESLTGWSCRGFELVGLDPDARPARQLAHLVVRDRLLEKGRSWRGRRERSRAGRAFAAWWAADHPGGAEILGRLREDSSRDGTLDRP